MRALQAGDCKLAADEINDGIAHDEAFAYLLAGTLYDATDCVETDSRRAAAYYRRAIDLGNDEARNFLGLMYGLGRGVGQDYRAANGWFTGGRTGAAAAAAPVANEPGSPGVDSANWKPEVVGYAYTVNQLARSKVRYPNASDGEGTVYVTLHTQTGDVTFSAHGAGSRREPLTRPSAFINAIAEAYAEAIRIAPRTDTVAQHDMTFETPWTFVRR